MSSDSFDCGTCVQIKFMAMRVRILKQMRTVLSEQLIECCQERLSFSPLFHCTFSCSLFKLFCPAGRKI